MDIPHMGRILSRSKAELISFTVDDARLEPTSGEPHGEGINVVIASSGFANFAHGSPPEFSPPDDDRVIKQPALLEISHQRRARLVDILAFLGKVLLHVLRGTAVVIPFGVVELDEAHPTLDQSAASRQFLANVLSRASLMP